MAQQKIVDYDLLASAGAAASDVAGQAMNKSKDTVWSRFLELGDQYLAHARKKTDDLIAATPEVDISKIDSRFSDKVTDFLRTKREIIAKSSKTMGLFGSLTKKGRAAIEEYNLAVDAITNLNANLVKSQNQVKFNLENRQYGKDANKYAIMDAEEIANGDIWNKMEIHDNGNMYFYKNGTGEEMLMMDYAPPGQYTDTFAAGFKQILNGVIQKKSAKEGTKGARILKEDPDGVPNSGDEVYEDVKGYVGIEQYGTMDSILTLINNSTPAEIKSFLYNHQGFDANRNMVDYIDLFITGGDVGFGDDGMGVEKFDRDGVTKTEEYVRLYEELQTTTDPEILDELKRFLYNHIEQEFDLFEVTEDNKQKNINKGTPDNKTEQAKLDLKALKNKNEIFISSFNDEGHTNSTHAASFVYLNAGDSYDLHPKASDSTNSGNTIITGTVPEDGWYLRGQYKGRDCFIRDYAQATTDDQMLRKLASGLNATGAGWGPNQHALPARYGFTPIN